MVSMDTLDEEKKQVLTQFQVMTLLYSYIT